MAARDTQLVMLNVLRALQEVDLLYFYQDPIIIQDDETEMVTWPNHQVGADSNRTSAFATLSQYQSTLDEKSYLAILQDGAIIRGNFVFRRTDLIAHSLWYWPCPFEIPPDDIRMETPLGALDLYCASWQEVVRFRTPLRFDYDPSRARRGHPASHLHMQTPECRIAVSRPLGFATFVRFVFRHFLPDDWQRTDIWEDLTDEFEDKSRICIANNDLYSPHINWARRL